MVTPNLLMKMKKPYLSRLTATVCTLTLLLGSCKNDVPKPIEEGHGAPGSVYNVQVKNLPGAALISYSLPEDKDLLYILARYTNKAGKQIDFRASYYTNQLKVEGFGDTSEYALQLYAVNRSEQLSKPLEVRIKPETPQIQLTAESLELKPDFGGMSFTFHNQTKADLAFIVLTNDRDGDEIAAETYFTARENGKFAIRGYDAVERKFGIVVRDKWGNLSDTLYTALTPIYEVKLDKSRFKEALFPNDAPATAWSGALSYMWDDIVNDKSAHTGNDASNIAKHVSFDLGVEAKLSRLNIKTIPDDKHWFNDVSLRFYEIWGATNPDPNGSFDSWTKLATVENIKPSGLSTGMITEDDRAVGRNGDDIDISIDMPKVRYIRIRSIKNWSGNTNLCVSEVTLWGNDK